MSRRIAPGLLLLVALAPGVGHAAEPTAPAAKPAAPAKPPTKPAMKPAAAPNGLKNTRAVDTSARRGVAAGPTLDDARLGADSPELRALYLAERELFPPAMPPLGASWPNEIPFPAPQPEGPLANTSGLVDAPVRPVPRDLAEGGKDLSWLSKLKQPDLPVRWDARVVRYLEFWKDDPRGRAIFATWLRRSGRYRDTIRRALRRKGLPEDLLYLSMIESGFEPVARSPVGAMGLWQFMPETGRIYGLSHDRYVDQRLHVQQSTDAAADYLGDLYRRFGTWELAMASYNMGYGGMLSVVRRYNTNDYWALSHAENSLPWETTLYVPKVVAAALVGRNLAVFGFQDVALDAALEGDEVPAPPNTALASIAQAVGVTPKELEQLNPELRAGRTPPIATADYIIHVPRGKSDAARAAIAKLAKTPNATDKYVVRFGETLAEIAIAKKTTASKLAELNGFPANEPVRGGTTILVPRVNEAPSATPASMNPQRPVAVVPQDVFVYPDRRRVFYRVLTGDSVRDIATNFKVSVDELVRWNAIDPAARLVDGMLLQVFVPSDVDLDKSVSLKESDVRVIRAGTDDFFHEFDEKGRKRITVTAKAGDTLDAIGKRYGVTPTLMERVNRKPRSEALRDGDPVVVYLPAGAPGAQGAKASPATTTAPPGEASPAMDDLPALP